MREEELDGCYVVVSDVPPTDAPTQTLWDRYGNLQCVERDFRTLKLARALERRVRPLGLSVPEALDRLDGVRLYALGDPADGLWRLPTRWDEPQQELLAVLPPLPAPVLSLAKTGS